MLAGMRALSVLLAATVTFAVATGGCSRAGEESEGKRTPIPPPPRQVSIPADLRIAVTIDGVAQPPIDAAALGAQAPDFADDERRAWKLTRLVPAFDRTGAVVEAHGQGGVAIKLRRPAEAGAPQPVLFLTRRGGVAVTLVDPVEPFPTYHGQGGRLRRPGDPLPHLSPVHELAIVTTP